MIDMSLTLFSKLSSTKKIPFVSPRRWNAALCIGAIALAAAVLSPGHALAQESICGTLRNGYGPFDYRTSRSQLKVVEDFHFGPQVEALIRGQTTRIGGDLDYTLRASPNHHRALLSLLRYAEKSKTTQDSDMHWPFECYFERAVRFQHDDPIARMLYASFLGQQNRTKDANQQLKAAEAVADGNPFTFYNIGMIYTDLKEYDRALDLAHKAYRLGFKQMALRDRLKAAGKWRDPAPVAAQGRDPSPQPQ